MKILLDDGVLPLVVHPVLRVVQLLEVLVGLERVAPGTCVPLRNTMLPSVSRMPTDFSSSSRMPSFAARRSRSSASDLPALAVERVAPLLVFLLGLGVLLLAAEELRVDDDALHARRRLQRCILHVAGLLAEDRLQQLLFRRRIGFALRRDLADEDVAFDHLGADADDAVLVEILRGLFADVRNFARQLFFAALRVADLQFELLDVDRGEDVVRTRCVR